MKSLLFSFILLAHIHCSAQQRQPHKIIAYCTGKAENIKQFPIGKLTHIIYSFLKLNKDTLTFHDSAQRASLQQLVALKKEYPKLKVMVSIGGWSGCAPCSDLFSSAQHRNNFARTAVALFREYNIDGLDLDWEYPAIEGFPGHKYTEADRDNFTELLKALRKEMGNSFLLTFAAGGFTQYLERSIDWDAAMPLVDFVNLMTYDLVGGYATVTGHHTPLFGYREGQESTGNCVNWLLNRQVPAEKLIIGAAMYARVWENVPDTNHGLYQTGKFKRGVAFYDFEHYFNDSSGFTRYWDRKAKAPYQYNAAARLFATYDDERSVKHKCRFIRRNKLGGIMFWELIQDKKTGGLVDVMKKILK